MSRFKPKTEITRNILTLMTGTSIAQAIPIAISPILTRIYSPEEFGVLAIYIAVVSFIAIVVTMRYELAIVLPKTDKEAINVLALSLVIVCIIVLTVTLLIFLFKTQILSMLGVKSIGDFLYFVPVSVFLAGLNQSFNYWSNRKKYYDNISISQISQSITVGVGQVGLGSGGLSYGLIFGNILGRFICAFFLLNKFIKNDLVYIKEVNKKDILNQMRMYKDFPLINSLHAFSDIIRSSGSVMLIATFFGSAVLGVYALSLRVLQVPTGVVGSALGQVLYQRFTVIYNDNNDNLYEYVTKILLKLFILALPVFIFLYFVSPGLFAWVFGEKWRVAGEYSQILIPYLFMNFLISPISSIPIIIGKQKNIFYISLFGNLLYILTICVFSKLGMMHVLIILSVTQFLFYLYVLYWYLSILKEA
ncbi:MAG: hypothetical protein OFPII_24770 [Osedax symbiont Rs1]|nr:MAG: hypothetical protein OFPII_24770 [Osedax symbiont Rs1]